MKTSASPKRSLLTGVSSIKFLIPTLLLVLLGSSCNAENRQKKLLDVKELLKGSNDTSRVARALDAHLNCPEFLVSMSELSYTDILDELLDDQSSDVKYFLSTRQEPDQVQISAVKLPQTTFDIKDDTIVIIHGFQSTGSEDWIIDMKNALLSWKQVNVVMADWNEFAGTLDYTSAAKKTSLVGNYIAMFLQSIVFVTRKSKPQRWGSIHIIGHSLGAHISGITARKYIGGRTWPIKRITGLDPAQPCFSNTTVGLSKKDAPLVDVIHTCGEAFDSYGLGLFQRRGHIDFYPNGGKHQPGCDKAFEKNPVTYLLGWGLTEDLARSIPETICNHGQAYVYFTESIRALTNNKDCNFWGQKWDGSNRNVPIGRSGTCNVNKCPRMGILADTLPANGSYYVEIEKSAPYCYKTRSPR